MKDLFSQQAELYSKHRPVYPTELYAFILGFVDRKDRALDCATGNGQVARVLSQHFRKVFAIDISQSQLAHAARLNNIEYSISRAERTPFADNSFDLITVAQAYHWFDGTQFCREATRVARNGAVVAIWVYDLAHSGTSVDAIIHHWNHITLKPFWEKERNHVYNGYKDLPFDFERIPTPEFTISVDWSVEELIGHLSTWSALQTMRQRIGNSPFEEVVKEIGAAWGDSGPKKFTFPLTVHVGRVHK